jgi:hypothetical protein
VRLQVSKAKAEDMLQPLVAEAYEIASWLERDYGAKRSAGSFDAASDNARYEQRLNDWAQRTQAVLLEIFPSTIEVGALAHEPVGAEVTVAAGTDQGWFRRLLRMRSWARKLERILKEDLTRYTDLPIGERLFVEDIDSFSKVRDVNPQLVQHLLRDGRLASAGDDVLLALEGVLGEPLRRQEHEGDGGELYTTHVVLSGRRVPSALLAKGPGVHGPELGIADCGEGGAQLELLARSPADLLILQFGGRVSGAVAAALGEKVRARRASGRMALYCTVDGLDTARLLLAYRAGTVSPEP